jgi:DNA-directed RNA polymerase subunit N (RpoN/RPB10)
MRLLYGSAQGDVMIALVGAEDINPVRRNHPRDVHNIPSNKVSKAIDFKGNDLIKCSEEQLQSDETILSLIESVREGLLYHQPELCEEGINGTYFLKNRDGTRIAVFKPQDEEGNNDNNPKKSNESQDEFVNTGILAGEGALREVAAYLLDRDHFSGVPRTTMVTLSHATFRSSKRTTGVVTKTGSLQEYIDNVGAAWDFGPSAFRVRDVHKIGVLDLRILNNDRHGGNILLNKCPDGAFSLTPIDQGFSLSSTLDHATFEWLNWPQSHIPFDEHTKRYIQRINIEEDAELLAKLGVRPECIRTMKISTTLLKKGTAAGLTLYEIGSMAARIVFDQSSTLENIYEKASRLVEGDGERLLAALWSIMEVEVADKALERCCPSPRSKEIWRGTVGAKIAI